MLVIFEDGTEKEIKRFDEINTLPATGIYPAIDGKEIKSLILSKEDVARMIMTSFMVSIRRTNE